MLIDEEARRVCSWCGIELGPRQVDCGDLYCSPACFGEHTEEQDTQAEERVLDEAKEGLRIKRALREAFNDFM